MTMVLVRRVGAACVASLALGLLIMWIAPLAATGSSTSVIYACVKHNTGDVRLVHPGQSCRHSETRVQWNVKGPVGPVGPTGPMGLAGPAGPMGPTGPEGPAGADGVDGEDGADAVSGPPFVWACTPANYHSGSNTNAAVFVFNGSETTANVAVQILNKDGVNLAGVNVPIAPGGPPPVTYPGQTGTDTVAVGPGATLFVKWLMAFGDPSLGGDLASTVKIVSDQPIGVGANIEFSGFHPMMCVKVQ